MVKWRWCLGVLAAFFVAGCNGTSSVESIDAELESTVLFEDLFEGSIDEAWVISGNVKLNKGTRAQLTKVASMELALPTSGYRDVVVTTRVRGRGRSAADSFYVEWFDGAAWLELARIDGKTVWADMQWSLPDAANLAGFALRFRTEGPDRARGQVEEVRIAAVAAACISASECDDANPCTTDSCTDYDCVNEPAPTTPCTDGHCDGSGTCVPDTLLLDAPGLSSAEYLDGDGDGVFETFEDRQGDTVTTEVLRSDASDPGSIRRGTIEFDLSAIPSGSEILYAEYELRTSSVIWYGGLELEVFSYEGDGSVGSADATSPASLQDILAMSIDGTDSVADVTTGITSLVAGGSTAAGIRMQLASESVQAWVNHRVTIFGLGSPYDWDRPHLRVVYKEPEGLPRAIERVSLASDGSEANARSLWRSVPSDDGRFVVFGSDASNLVPDDTNGTTDIFVRDRQLGTTVRVDVSSTGEQSDGSSSSETISRDGHYVAFVSNASNLISDDTNGQADAFVHDLSTGTTERVSVGPGGAQLQERVLRLDMSADGRYVVFDTNAKVVSGDTDTRPDIYLHDRETDDTWLVSNETGGVNGSGNCQFGRISPSGAFVVFQASGGIYLHDVETGQNELVSLTHDGQPSTGYSGESSDDGRFVAFESFASDLVPNDTNGEFDVFLRDRLLGTTQRVSLTTGGAQYDGYSRNVDLSGDGARAVFRQTPPDYPNNQRVHALLWETSTSTVSLLSASDSGEEGNAPTYGPNLSANGSWVGFPSSAGNLAAGDTNAVADAFVVGLE
jgi:Tol biopolymer transport system component